jgi:quercetin dioxygenase-like cupin family protein
MGQIVPFEASALPWLGTPEDWAGKVRSGEPDVRYKMLTEAKGAVPGIQLVEFEAGHSEPAHSHPESEVIYVLEGEIQLGATTLGRGAGVFIEKDTVYALETGPVGATFLRVGLGVSA